jgi:hypothetical protein
LISAAPFNNEPADEALRRIRAKYPKIKTFFFDINNMLGNHDSEIDRNDALLLSIFMYLRQDAQIRQNWTTRQNWTDQYRAWKKRGKDPEKLKKLCRDGLLIMGGGDDINPQRGRDYFELIAGMICSDIERI